LFERDEVRDCVVGRDDWRGEDCRVDDCRGVDWRGADCRAGADRCGAVLGAETLGAETLGAETLGGGGVYLYFWAMETPLIVKMARAMADAFSIRFMKLSFDGCRFALDSGLPA
jgi:hypothetical protein